MYGHSCVHVCCTYVLCIRIHFPIHTTLPFDGTNDSIMSSMSGVHGLLDSLSGDLGWEDCGVHSCVPYNNVYICIHVVYTCICTHV